MLAWLVADSLSAWAVCTHRDELCLPCRAPAKPYSLDEGAGALISIGALRSVSLEDMEDCVLRQWTTGVTYCLASPNPASSSPRLLHAHVLAPSRVTEIDRG